MNETRRTATYVAVAGVMALVAWWLSPPVEITPQELRAAKIGEPFYDNFNPNDATSIRVVGFDEAKAIHQSFGVKFEKGKWTIPSHHNYPADGADRLAKTASSVKGIKREEFVSDSEQNHEKLGVVDPLDEDRAKLKGRGQRITLTKGDNTLVDLIIGKQLKDRPGFYYIRKPGENTTYVAKLSLDLSTKFADWVETDLLKLNRDDLKEIVMNNYSIDEANGRLIPGEVNKLERDKSADPWKLDGLDETKEELDTSKVNAMVSALDDLKLVGVRPKPKGFRPDLTIDPEFVKRQADVDLLVRDLQARGFALQMDRKKHLHLFSNEGELAAATSKGVVYSLQFGEVFLGDETEIEIGTAKEGDEKSDGKEDDKDKAAAKESSAKQPSRYLFVTARFDDEYLGAPPEEPEKPAAVSSDEADENAPKIKPKKSGKSESAPAPETDSDASSNPNKSDNGNDNQSDKADENCGPPSALKGDNASEAEDVKDESDSAAKGDEDDADVSKEPPAKKGSSPDKSQAGDEGKKEKSPEEVKKDYELKLKKYKGDLKAYEDKVTAGKNSVDELNARFGDWYYVISAENFSKLHLSRKDLVKEKGKPADGKKSEKTPAQDPFPGNDTDPGVDDPDQKKDADDDKDAQSDGK